MIGGSLELIKRGHHREAMFWIAVTHSRCQKVILRDAPEEMTQSFKSSYQELAAALRIPSPVEIRRRSAEVAAILPRVWNLAEALMDSNPEITDDCS